MGSLVNNRWLLAVGLLAILLACNSRTSAQEQSCAQSCSLGTTGQCTGACAGETYSASASCYGFGQVDAYYVPACAGCTTNNGNLNDGLGLAILTADTNCPGGDGDACADGPNSTLQCLTGYTCAAAGSSCASVSCCAGLACDASNTCSCSSSCDNPNCPGYDATACACAINSCYSSSCSGYDDLACNCPNDECYSEACPNWDYCTCYPDNCSPPTCDPDGDVCDPYGCSYDYWECFIDCACEDFCDDLTAPTPMPNASPAPVDADPNVIAPKQQTAPLIAHPMCDGQPTVKDPRAIDPAGTSFVAHRTQEPSIEWRIG